MAYLVDAANVIRSKNAGPMNLTYDVIFRSKEFFDRARNSPEFQPASLSDRLDISESAILFHGFIGPSLAFKLTARREAVSGSRLDRDVYGCQEHVPLFGIQL